MPKVIEPAGEAKEEFEIYSELERRMNLGTAFSNGLSAEQWLEAMWGELRETASSHGHALPDLESFLSGDIETFPDPEPEAVFLSDFRHDPQSNALPTPSGKIELYSETIASFCCPDCPGQATWLAPREWLGSKRAKSFPLHLISGQPETRLHSQLDNGAFSRSRKIQGREPILIHPIDAVRRDIADGDVVSVRNDRGHCLAGAVVTEAVRENVVFLWTGAWYDPDFTRDDHRDNHGNPNVLSHDLRTSSLSQGPASHSVLVEIEKFEGDLPAIKAFEPPEIMSS